MFISSIIKMAKITKIQLFVTLLSLLILTACQSSSGGTVNQVQPDPAVAEAKRLEAQKAETDRLLKLQDQLNAIVLTGDIKNCAQIKNDIYFTSCNVHILANQAEFQKNPQLCQKGQTDEVRQTCLVYYKQTLEKPVIQSSPADEKTSVSPSQSPDEAEVAL
jgi:hypothetical protein